jgi:hypothetical protein
MEHSFPGQKVVLYVAKNMGKMRTYRLEEKAASTLSSLW